MNTINPGLNVEEPDPPTILRLPNEILFRILNSVCDNLNPNAYRVDPLLPNQKHQDYSHRVRPFVEIESPTGKKYEVCQNLVLRSVCRRFRYISPELDFWYQPGFRFTELVAYREPSRTPNFPHFFIPNYCSLRRIAEEGLLKLLVADANFVDSLGRRKAEWVFEGLEGLIVVMEDVPLFKQNARTIGLWITMQNSTIPSPVDTAIDMLAVCFRITTLSIRETWSVNLSGIGTKFPFLENLNCLDIVTFEGSLDELSGLETLQMRLWQGDERIIRRPCLPLQCTKTLTTLSLNWDKAIGNSLFDLNALDEFISLKSLKIGPLNPRICDSLLRSHCQLEVFEPSIFRPLVPIDKLITMFQAPCLRTVRQFSLSHYYEAHYVVPHGDHDWVYPSLHSEIHVKEHYWRLIFDTFTSLLSSVEQVKIDAAFHLECCAYFSRLRNLKLLHWDGSRYLPFGMSYENPKEEVEKALESVFSEFREKPRVFCVLDYRYMPYPCRKATPEVN